VKDVVSIEVVEDRTEGSRCDEGFLRVRRLRVRNHYADGTRSPDYACDVVSRRRVDAVAIVIYDLGDDRTVRVALKTGVRPPVYLRRHKDLTQPDEREYLLLAEIVAGMLEEEDVGPEGPARRAVAECREEAGYDLDPAATEALGAAMFASPGVTDEKVHYRAVEADLERRTPGRGDGSVMEEAGDVVLLGLDEAIRMCRRGEIADAKTEIALLRLCDHIGYLPQFGCFARDLPPEQRPDPDRLEWLMGR
jgi:ADP-ribose pyrophosphatase